MTAPLAQPEELPNLPAPTRLDEVKGWFWPADQILFDWFLSRQNADPSGGGDLLELGAYLGKSAIFLGGYLKEGRSSRSATSSIPRPRTTATTTRCDARTRP